MVISADRIGSCKSSYHSITTTAPRYMLFRLPLKPHVRLESNLEDNIFLKRFTLFPLGSLSCIFLCCCGSYFLIKMHFFHVLFILFAKTRVLCWFYIYKGYLILCIFFIVLSMCSTTWLGAVVVVIVFCCLTQKSCNHGIVFSPGNTFWLAFFKSFMKESYEFISEFVYISKLGEHPHVNV